MPGPLRACSQPLNGLTFLDRLELSDERGGGAFVQGRRPRVPGIVLLREPIKSIGSQHFWSHTAHDRNRDLRLISYLQLVVECGPYPEVVTGTGAIALGGGVLTVTGIGVGVLAIPHQPAWWVLVFGVVLPVVAGLGLILWGAIRHPNNPQAPDTAFIRGTVDQSSITESYSEAHHFIDGDVRRSWLRRNQHRPKK